MRSLGVPNQHTSLVFCASWHASTDLNFLGSVVNRVLGVDTGFVTTARAAQVAFLNPLNPLVFSRVEQQTPVANALIHPARRTPGRSRWFS